MFERFAQHVLAFSCRNNFWADPGAFEAFGL